MKIGVFDSGIGGLLILKSIVTKLPKYDYVYLGDTLRVPYGNRSQEAIYQFTKEAVEYLLKKQKCKIVIIACNTASTHALRRIQREYLPKHYPDRKVLGVIIPTVEVALEKKYRSVGVLATNATVTSKVFIKEFKKADPGVRVYQQAAPLLVPFIENGSLDLVEPIMKGYINTLLKKRVDALLLGCTHYPILKPVLKKILEKNRIAVISQDSIIPRKLSNYLQRHPEVVSLLSRGGNVLLLVTDVTPHMQTLAKRWFGKKANLHTVSL